MGILGSLLGAVVLFLNGLLEPPALRRTTPGPSDAASNSLNGPDMEENITYKVTARRFHDMRREAESIETQEKRTEVRL